MMTIFQKMMYATITITVACAVGVANYVYFPIEPTKKATDFFLEIDNYNKRTLKSLFPYEEVNYSLQVPNNMTYTTADFQKFKGTYLEKRKAVTTDYYKNILFAGDSITYHLGMSSLNRPLANYDVVAAGGLMVTSYADYKDTPVYNKSDSTEKSSIQWISELKPKIIYINLGTNGISIISNEKHIRLYEALLDRIVAASPGSIIVLVSSPPWATQASSQTKTEIPVLNKKIDHFNMYLLELAKKRGFYYLNASEDLKDSLGNLKGEYAASANDGIHWSQAGRTAYLNYILEHPIPGY